jgi:hypothetical protein
MKKWIATAALAATLATSAMPALAADPADTSGWAMATDLVVARPVGAVLTLAGSVLFVVSLPFTAVTNTIDDAAKALVVGPARETFVRCLGCTNTGRVNDGEDPR